MFFRTMTRITTVSMAAILLAMSLTSVVGAFSPGNSAFESTWSRTDRPVLDGTTARTWMWGPEANTQIMNEAYAESPGDTRQVQYFDKARMEITNPNGDSGSIWYVTNGLLVVELITGKMQVGDNSFEARNPADVNVAGDFDDPTGPTYATFGSLLDEAPASIGTTITDRVDRQGNVSNDPALSGQDVSISYIDNVTNHAIAAPFWSFMNSSGTVYENGQFVNRQLFEDPFFATGRPITEAYWAEVKVGGTYKDVLIQCFERRCLTYTPGNSPGFIVEAGNVGQHYYEWRYGDDQDDDNDNGNDNDNGGDNDNGNDDHHVPATEYQFLNKFGLPEFDYFIEKPNDVATAPNGDVFITDTVNKRILRFDSRGVLVTAWGSEGTGNGEFMAPRGIAVDGNHNVYIVDKNLDRVQKFDRNGAFLTAWGATGSGDGQFDSPHGIAIDEDFNVFVADQGNNRVQVFGPFGTYQSQFGSLGSGNGQLNAPHGIDVSSGGLIYVADKGNNRVHVFNSDGTFNTFFGQPGSGDGQFDGPMDLVVVGGGDLYVSETGNDRVQRFQPALVVSPASSTLQQAVRYQFAGSLDDDFIDPTGLAADSSGRIIIADRGTNRIMIFAQRGPVIGGLPERVDVWFDDSRGRFSVGNPDGIVVGPNGRVYTVDNGQDLIKVFSADGEIIAQYGPEFDGNVTLVNPLDLAVDANGNLYITDPDLDAVIKLSANGQFVARFGTSGSGNGQFDFPAGIAVDDDGYIFVADVVNGRVQKFSPGFDFIAAWTTAGDEALDSPVGIAIHDDRVYLTDSGNADKVHVFDRDGNHIASWDGFDQPAGIAVDSYGYVYVGDKLNLIQKFSPNGDVIAQIGANGTGDGELTLGTAGPRIALDADGNLYVSDSGNQRVQVFQPIS